MAKAVKTYEYIDKNIYKVGSRYRVRVEGFSKYVKTKKQAKEARKMLKNITKSEPLW